ncbi:hypothetical protein [Egbenema bharatensis]
MKQATAVQRSTPRLIHINPIVILSVIVLVFYKLPDFLQNLDPARP